MTSRSESGETVSFSHRANQGVSGDTASGKRQHTSQDRQSFELRSPDRSKTDPSELMDDAHMTT